MVLLELLIAGGESRGREGVERKERKRKKRGREVVG